MDGGKGNGNRNYIHWEICYSKSGGTRFLEAEKRCAKEIAADLKARGWGIDRVKKHQDFSGKYCPHRTLDMGYQRIIDMIKAELGNSTSTTPAPTPNQGVTTGAMYRVIAGSYSERSNAEAMQERLKRDGFNSFLLGITAADGKTYLRVVAGSYKDRSNAEKTMKELIAKDYNAFIAIYDNNELPVTNKPATPTTNNSIAVGSKVNIIGTYYSTGQKIPEEQKGNKSHTVQQINGNKALLKEIISWVNLKDLKLVTSSSQSNSLLIPSKGKFSVTTPSGIRFRDKASVKNGILQGTYSCNESVIYDSVVVAEGYTWISWVSASTGARRYMPVIDHSNNEVWGKCV